MSRVAAKYICGNAAVAVVLSELDGIFILKGEQMMALKAFTLLPSDFSKSLVKHCSLPLGNDVSIYVFMYLSILPLAPKRLKLSSGL